MNASATFADNNRHTSPASPIDGEATITRKDCFQRVACTESPPFHELSTLAWQDRHSPELRFEPNMQRESSQSPPLTPTIRSRRLLRPYPRRGAQECSQLLKSTMAVVMLLDEDEYDDDSGDDNVSPNKLSVRSKRPHKVDIDDFEDEIEDESDDDDSDEEREVPNKEDDSAVTETSRILRSLEAINFFAPRSSNESETSLARKKRKLRLTGVETCDVNASLYEARNM